MSSRCVVLHWARAIGGKQFNAHNCTLASSLKERGRFGKQNRHVPGTNACFPFRGCSKSAVLGVSSSTCGCCWPPSAVWRPGHGAWGGGCPPAPYGSAAPAGSAASGAAPDAPGHADLGAVLLAAPASLHSHRTSF